MTGVPATPTVESHWPYTARMNKPMVKEFDVGLAAQFWVLLDLQRLSHYYPVADNRRGNRNGEQAVDGNENKGQQAYRAENTEELAVTVAASLGTEADGDVAAGGDGGQW